MKNIVFFNHWHYGDLFSTRGMVFDIMAQTPECQHFYIHAKNPKVTKDISLPFTGETNVLQHFTFNDRLAVSEDRQTLFVNTWVGSYGYAALWPNKHPSYVSHVRMYEECYKLLREHFDVDLKLNSDVWHYVPEIDWRAYDLTKVDNLETQNFVYLFCNNDVHSQQSSMGDMHEIINIMAYRHPKDTFIVTKRIETAQPNIIFTDDIFQEENDLIEIAYLSHRCDMIIGKNSSPFTYTNTRQNLSNSNNAFVCFSHAPEDTLPWGLDINTKFVFSELTETKPCLETLEQTRILMGR